LRFLYVLSRYPDGLEMREESGLEMKTHLWEIGNRFDREAFPVRIPAIEWELASI
jgi:hypothetical protein